MGRSPVASWWTVAALCGGAALTRRRPVVAGGAALLAAGIAANRLTGYLPDAGAVRLRLGLGTGRPPLGAADPVRGGLARVRIPADPRLRIPAPVAWVYTPPGFDGSGAVRYPVITVLHGSPGTGADWFVAGLGGLLDELIGAGELRPVVVVTPDLNAWGTHESSCLDSSRGGSQVETFLTGPVQDWVNDHLPVHRRPEGRVLAGMSAGGFGTLDQGLRHPQLWSTLLSLLPYGHPGLGGRHQLGDPALIAAHTPSTYVDTIPLPDTTGVFLGYGTREFRREVGRTAHDLGERLVARGVDTRVCALPGYGHSWWAAIALMREALRYAERRLALLLDEGDRR